MAFTYKGLSAQLSRHIVTSEEIDRQLIAHSTYRKRDAVVCKIETVE